MAQPRQIYCTNDKSSWTCIANLALTRGRAFNVSTSYIFHSLPRWGNSRGKKIFEHCGNTADAFAFASSSGETLVSVTHNCWSKKLLCLHIREGWA